MLQSGSSGPTPPFQGQKTSQMSRFIPIRDTPVPTWQTPFWYTIYCYVMENSRIFPGKYHQNKLIFPSILLVHPKLEEEPRSWGCFSVSFGTIFWFPKCVLKPLLLIGVLSFTQNIQRISRVYQI